MKFTIAISVKIMSKKRKAKARAHRLLVAGKALLHRQMTSESVRGG